MWVWDRPNSKHVQPSNRVVFIRWDAKLGDTVVLSWVFRELKKQRPDLQISVITSPALEGLFRDGYGIDSIFLAGKKHGWHQLPNIAKELYRPKYVVHLSEIWRPRDLRFVRQLDPQHVVGLDDGLKTIDIKLGGVTGGKHFSERLIPWLKNLGMDVSYRQYWIPRNTDLAQKVASQLPSKRLVGFCPYGASIKRHLSIGQIAFVIKHLLEKYDLGILMLVQEEQAKKLTEELGHEPWFEQLTFYTTNNTLELFELVARCDVVVSVDTAIVHIASGLGKPLLAMYALHYNQFDMWRAINHQAVCQFVVMGPPVFESKEAIDLAVNIYNVLSEI